MTDDEIHTYIEAERACADAKYGPFTSAHEGLGVLIEEVDELRHAVRGNLREEVRHEAMQVAAVAWRLALSMNKAETLIRSGMMRK